LRILITAANSAEAYKLKNKFNQDEVILGDYLELPAFMLKAANMVQLPHPDSPAYAHQMLTLCLDRQIDTLYAMREEEAVLLNEAKQLFVEYGILVHG
jgi:hypothetical protein